MPPRTVKCTICGQEVTKRSTLSLKILGGSPGRACRTHELVKELVEKDHKAKDVARLKKKVADTFSVIGHSSFVRVMHTFHSVPVEILYSRISFAGYSKTHVKKVRKAVEDCGGPLMSEEEVLKTQYMAALKVLRH